MAPAGQDCARGRTALILRRQNAADDVAVRAIVNSAFGDHGSNVVRLLDALDAANHSPISLVAEDGQGGLAGHVQLSHSWLDAPERLVEVLVLSPLAVRPDQQG